MSLRSLVPCYQQATDNIFTGAVSDVRLFAGLREAGLDAVLSLLPESEANLGTHRAAAQAAGLDFIHIPVDGPSGLSRSAVAALHEYLEQNPSRKVLIYCASGNRCGALLALRAGWHQQLSGEQAMALGRQAGMKSLEAYVAQLLSGSEARLGTAQQ